MAGLEPLMAIVYHEKQQQGSMLCAQHAVNNVLQGNYFTAPDLSDIARNLDALEESYDDANRGRTSTNMDDTGFFSVQVLENALKVWGLNLVRWRSMEMRPFQDQPHTQLAFILNLQQHWFSLRRFGPAAPNVHEDPGSGHWFNLNSFLSAPEWVSKLYLGMVLHQAEQEGYSVFAVVQADPSAPLALPRTEADELSARLPEPTSATSTRLSTTTTAAVKEPSASSFTAQTHPIMGDFEDEDMELQAVLQASLMGSSPGDVHSPEPPSLTRPYIPRIPGSWPESSSGFGPDSGADTPTRYTRHRYSALNGLSNLLHAPDADRVAESMARNRAIMQRMRREQEMAQRELYHEEVRRSTRTGEEDEAEMLRNAIAESQALARIEGHGRPDDDDDDDVDKDEMQDEEYDVPVMERETAYRMPSVPAEERVYDDDDEELQRALKASLEAVPQGFIMPDLRSAPVRMLPQEVQPNSAETVAERDLEEMETSSEAEASIAGMPSSDVPQETEVVSVDELRRRRLARFGG